MVVVNKVGKEHSKQVIDTLSFYEVSQCFNDYIEHIKDVDDYYIDIVEFRTTKNALLYNIYYKDELVCQIVQSYNSKVLLVTENVCMYTGFFSMTTTKHMLRFFKDYCKFNFTYDDIRANSR